MIFTGVMMAGDVNIRGSWHLFSLVVCQDVLVDGLVDVGWLRFGGDFVYHRVRNWGQHFLDANGAGGVMEDGEAEQGEEAGDGEVEAVVEGEQERLRFCNLHVEDCHHGDQNKDGLERRKTQN